MERELLELASGMLVVWGRLAIGTCLSITKCGSIAADGSCLFFLLFSVFCFSLGDGEPGYRQSPPKSIPSTVVFESLLVLELMRSPLALRKTGHCPSYSAGFAGRGGSG